MTPPRLLSALVAAFYFFLLPMVSLTADEPVPQELIQETEAILEKLYTRLDEISAGTSEPLFKRHLLSVKGLVMNAHTKLQYHIYDGRAKGVEAFAEQMRELYRGFTEGKADEWESYTTGLMPLLHSHFSWHDGCFTSYFYSLPDDWDPEKAYPLFMELHGTIRMPWYTVMVNFYGLEEGIDPEDRPMPGTMAFRQRAGYYFYPWGRGNLRYHGHGEYDVLESLHDIKKRLKVDEDRQYLSGFSMGGAGTWAFATRMPDRWAAVTIYSGKGMVENPGVPHAENINNLPVYLFVGEKDHLKRSMDQINEDLIEAGTPPEEYWVESDLGHGFSGKAQAHFTQAMQQHVRERPDSFTYIVDTEDHLGIWGVRMKRDILISATPRMEVQVDGEERTVRIQTEGTEAIKVEMGDRGLRLPEGIWTIEWNGRERYSGPIANILLRADGTQGSFDPDQRHHIWNLEKW